MSKFRITIVPAITVAIIVAMSIYSCGSGPSDTGKHETGSVELQIFMVRNLNKIKRSQKTDFDSLIIEITADDMEKRCYSRMIDNGEELIKDTITEIPAGSGRKIQIYTVNKAGEVIHDDSAGIRTVKITANSLTVVQTVLVPAKGSIYVQITGVPSSIDSVSALFASDDGDHYRTAVARSTKINISIDNIDNKSKGQLLVAGTTVSGDTICIAQKEVTVDAVKGGTIQLIFNDVKNGGMISLDGKLLLPGVLLATGDMSGFEHATEKGTLVITEIMYAADDSEYIEIYNPGTSKLTYDTIILGIDGKERLFFDVSIEPGNYFVFGRRALPWVDIVHSVKSALDLTTKGNMITLRDKKGVLFDRVIFTGGSNSIEWPNCPGKQSVYLEKNYYSSTKNNSGRNWSIASVIIGSGTSQKGTPGKL